MLPYILILLNLRRPLTMLWFLFTAIYIILYLIPMAQASNLSSADLSLIQSVANTTIVKVDAKGHAHFPPNCNSSCKFLRRNASTGGDCFTLLMTTPTCLYVLYPPRLTDSQCLNIPQHMNLTLLNDVIAALDACRNGATGSFSPLNVTVLDPPNIEPTNSTTNTTLKRRATDITSSVTWPCPTFLYVGGAARSSELNIMFLIGAVFMGCMGMVFGLKG